MRTNSPTQNAEPELPPPEVRGWIGLFLFLHLFAVAVALTSYTSPSALQVRLRQVVSPYIASLNFDLNPDTFPTGRFYLTHALENDVDFVIEVEGTLPDGSTESTTVPWPGLWPGERRRHYQALANYTGQAAVAENTDLQAVLPTSIAGSLLKQWGAERGIVRCKAHQLIAFESRDSSKPADRNPFDAQYYKTVYQAHLLISGDHVDLVKITAEGENAAVDKEP